MKSTILALALVFCSSAFANSKGVKIIEEQVGNRLQFICEIEAKGSYLVVENSISGPGKIFNLTFTEYYLSGSRANKESVLMSDTTDFPTRGASHIFKSNSEIFRVKSKYNYHTWHLSRQRIAEFATEFNISLVSGTGKLTVKKETLRTEALDNIDEKVRVKNCLDYRDEFFRTLPSDVSNFY